MLTKNINVKQRINNTLDMKKEGNAYYIYIYIYICVLRRPSNGDRKPVFDDSSNAIAIQLKEIVEGK